MNQQLELRFWPRDWLWSAVKEYMDSRELLGRSEGTMDDYEIRATWLLRVLGHHVPLGAVTYEQLEELARKHGPDGTGELLYETIKQRFKFLRQVQTYAAKRKVIGRDDVLPRIELPRDVLHKKPVPSISQFREFRFALAPGRFRWLADFFFGTGHHTADAYSLEWWMLEPDFEWTTESGQFLARGRYWRRNQKNPRCEACWFPMEPEFREAVIELFREHADRRPNQLVTGPVWNLKRTFDAASDRAGLPRFTPIRLRAGFARVLASRYPRELVRLAMGHEAHDSKIQGGQTTRVATLERHYLGPSADVLTEAMKQRRHPPKTAKRKPAKRKRSKG